MADGSQGSIEFPSIQVYPEPPAQPVAAWKPPTSRRAGWKGLTAEQLRGAAFADADPLLA